MGLEADLVIPLPDTSAHLTAAEWGWGFTGWSGFAAEPMIAGRSLAAEAVGNMALIEIIG